MPQSSTTAPTVTTAEPTQLLWLDPATLAAHPANLRVDLGDLTELTASIAARGVVEPIIVVADGDRYRILAGHRRCAAAITAGSTSVPCLVRPDLSAGTDQTITMIVENVHRQDLSVAEVARGYAQLALAGLTAAKIAKATGTKPARVKRHLTVADSPTATETAARYGLSLDQALAVAEFDSDSEAVKLLVVTAIKEPQRWDHVLARLRQGRQAEAEHAAALARLVEAGITVIDPDDLPAGAQPLHRLTGPDGARLDADTHTACPGHAVALWPWDAEPRDAYCLDPTSHGHQLHARHDLAGSAGQSDREAAADRARIDRRRVIEGNRDWRAARQVRREFLRQVLARKTPPKGTLRYVTEEVVAHPERLADGHDALLAELLSPAPATQSWVGVAGSHAAAQATDARLPLILLAQVAAAAEVALHDHTWRQPRPDQAARWLSWLAGIGYSLSDIETQVIAAGSQPDPHHADNGSTEDGSTEDGSTEDGPTEDGPTEDGPTEDGPTEDGDDGEKDRLDDNR